MRDTEEKCCMAYSPQSPIEIIRNKARYMRDSAYRLDKLADKLERIDWNSELSQAFFEAK